MSGFSVVFVEVIPDRIFMHSFFVDEVVLSLRKLNIPLFIVEEFYKESQLCTVAALREMCSWSADQWRTWYDLDIN
jgi:hypothetical protein